MKKNIIKREVLMFLILVYLKFIVFDTNELHLAIHKKAKMYIDFNHLNIYQMHLS